MPEFSRGDTDRAVHGMGDGQRPSRVVLGQRPQMAADQPCLLARGVAAMRSGHEHDGTQAGNPAEVRAHATSLRRPPR